MITFETFFVEKVLTASKSWVKSKSPFATSISYHIELKISPLEDLCDHKSSSNHRTITPLALEDRCDPKQSSEYQQSVSKIFPTIFFEPQTLMSHSPKLSFWRSTMQFCTKIGKSPLENLCDHKSSSKHRVNIPFASKHLCGDTLLALRGSFRIISIL